ncbi:MAG: PAS domain-containing protein [Chloroflexi bacterium]|nr:PAS domain-containing protein [Chloroflexota bacterium]
MITAVLILVTAVGLGVGAWHAARLTQGAPRSERWVWALVAILLTLGMVHRVVLGIRTLGAEDIQLALGIQVSLAVSSVTVALVLSWIHPVLRRYREADAARSQSDERLRRALSGASNPIGIADAGGRWIYTNDAGCTFFGYPREQILGRPFRDFLAGPAPTTTSGVEVAREQGSARIIREVIRGDGTHVTVQCDLIPFENDSVLITLASPVSNVRLPSASPPPNSRMVPQSICAARFQVSVNSPRRRSVGSAQSSTGASSATADSGRWLSSHRATLDSLPATDAAAPGSIHSVTISAKTAATLR